MKRMAALLAVMGAMTGVVPASAMAADADVQQDACKAVMLLGVRIC
jgi:hypothetical protein